MTSLPKKKNVLFLVAYLFLSHVEHYLCRVWCEKGEGFLRISSHKWKFYHHHSALLRRPGVSRGWFSCLRLSSCSSLLVAIAHQPGCQSTNELHERIKRAFLRRGCCLLLGWASESSRTDKAFPLKKILYNSPAIDLFCVFFLWETAGNTVAELSRPRPCCNDGDHSVKQDPPGANAKPGGQQLRDCRAQGEP